MPKSFIESFVASTPSDSIQASTSESGQAIGEALAAASLFGLFLVGLTLMGALVGAVIGNLDGDESD